LYYNNIQKPIIQDDPTQNIMLFSLSISDRIQSLAVFFFILGFLGVKMLEKP